MSGLLRGSSSDSTFHERSEVVMKTAHDGVTCIWSLIISWPRGLSVNAQKKPEDEDIGKVVAEAVGLGAHIRVGKLFSERCEEFT